MQTLTIKNLRSLANMTQVQFSDYLDIPLTTIQNWESNSGNKRECKPYIINLIKEKLINDGVIKEEDIEKFNKK